MMNANQHIQVFEFESLSLVNLPELKEALDAFYGDFGVPYYDLTRTGVRFKNYVGALRVGRYTIEILPKMDRMPQTSKDVWQRVLIAMLRQSGLVKTYAPSSSNLGLQKNSILDLYITLFLNECAYLLQLGLIKKYQRIEGNQLSLRGHLVMSKHLTVNALHKERFYVEATAYNQNHIFNQILAETLLLLNSIDGPVAERNRIATQLLNFPAVDRRSIRAKDFDRLVFDRKSQPYFRAIEFAKLLLLNYHPDVVKGRNHVLALLFDMNHVWEAWVFRQLQKQFGSEYEIKAQVSRNFWKPQKGHGQQKNIKPDIFLKNRETGLITIVDTKWKIPLNNQPADGDLKQMFAYNKRFQARKSVLLYPGKNVGYSGHYFGEDDQHGQCQVHFLDILDEQGNLKFPVNQTVSNVLGSIG